jgi:hypothetical protein
MARVVETVAGELGDAVHWEKVVTKELQGAERYREMCKRLGKPMPVPSIVIDGELVFAVTPGTDELREYLEDLLKKKGQRPS